MLYKPKEHYIIVRINFFETPGFRRIIFQNKITMLEKFLHFVDNEELGDSYNKSVKIQSILDKITQQFKFLLELGSNVSIDEPSSFGKENRTGNRTFQKKIAFCIESIRIVRIYWLYLKHHLVG